MRLPRAVTAFPTLLRVGVAEAIAYRAEFLVWMLTMTLPLIMLALWTAVAREHPVGRFDTATFTAYYLATLIVRQLSSSWVFWEINREIREGTMALRMTRPLHPLVAHAAVGVANVPIRGVISAPLAGIMLLAAGSGHVTHDPLIGVMFLTSLAGAFLLSFAISASLGTLAFYIESSIGIWQLWMGVFALASGYLVPLELFSPRIDHLARALPFAYMQAVPVEMLIGLRTRAEAGRDLGVQWVYALSALLLLRFLWQRAARRFAAYGG
jgi:ABC-2 type transport system permease protein